ncbi:aldo/keto reductase [Actinoplanes sp. NPDC051633]|uniref:aldo/keto reductase n=1 Tax=Actinoplanes sp. NPDC051633 TaxID=3155670 RepID=UPI0034347732
MMRYREWAGARLPVSMVGLGAAPLGDVYGPVDLGSATRAVRTALDMGVNIVDVAPYYGATRAETVLGKALAGVDRESYLLATKVGRYGLDAFDFSAERVRRSVDESLGRLGAEYIDLIQVHDIEFGDLDRIVDETIPALDELRTAGKVRHIGVTGYPLAALERVARGAAVDSVLSYCRYTLLDRGLTRFLPSFRDAGVAVFNASPLAMGALTRRGAPPWHPAPADMLRRCAAAAEWCEARGLQIERLAIQFATAHPGFVSTFVGMADESEVRRAISWALDPIDDEQLAEVDRLLAPVRDRPWPSGRPENADTSPPPDGEPA